MAHVECIQCRENGKKKDIHISIYFSVAEYILVYPSRFPIDYRLITESKLFSFCKRVYL